MPIPIVKSFLVVTCPVEQLEEHLNANEPDYVNTVLAWYMKGDAQWVTAVFIARRLAAPSVARPVGPRFG